jgi:hypothetical protein
MSEQLALNLEGMPPLRLLTPFERGMELSQRSADHKWTTAQASEVYDAIVKTARMLPEFTADDIWSRLPATFPKTKGLAAILKSAANDGICQPTDRVRKTSRGGDSDHGQRLTVWRSL